MQGDYRLATGDRHREVQQAGRVASARQQHDDWTAGDEQARFPDPLLDLGFRGHSHSEPSSRACATKISVAAVKPFSRTSAMRSKLSAPSACSTTGLVTSTSPAPARAPTREAMLTSRP